MKGIIGKNIMELIEARNEMSSQRDEITKEYDDLLVDERVLNMVRGTLLEIENEPAR